MPFVATREQVDAFQAFSHRPGFSQEAISVDFLTTMEFVKNVLPPGLEPAETPTGTISISTWESKLCGEFECTSVTLQVTRNGIVGQYVLTLLVSGDMPVTWGREIWGEIKKTGASQIYRSGKRRFGYGERKGVRLVELAAEFGDELPPNKQEFLGYEIKAYPASNGIGLHGVPGLVTLKTVNHNTARATGKGQLTLRGTKSDPLHEVPIVSIGDFSYMSGVTDWTVVDEQPLGFKDEYLPYLIGRHYDDLRVFNIGASFDQSEGVEEEKFPVQVVSSS